MTAVDKEGLRRRYNAAADALTGALGTLTPDARQEWRDERRRNAGVTTGVLRRWQARGPDQAVWEAAVTTHEAWCLAVAALRARINKA